MVHVLDIDKRIEEMQREIANLEAQRAAQSRKIEGFDAHSAAIERICAEYGVSRDELYLAQSASIVEWVKSLAKASDRPEVYNELKSYFARVVAREGTGTKKSAGSNEPKLEVGSYRNPHTGETLEKIKRNPKPLDNWIAEYGIETVSSWKV